MIDKPEKQVNFMPALTSLPLDKMLPFVNALLQNVTERQLAETCFDFGIEPNITFMEKE